MPLIAFLALVVRLLVLPSSQTIHADAVSRVFSALDWLADPHYITHGYWGPLHQYLTAFAVWIYPDQVVAPKLLNILLASLSVFPLYGFTKNVFGSRTGAIYASLVFVFSPIIMHTSFQALSDVSYAFFILSSMYFLSQGLKENGNLMYAILAGVAITLAAATRYESWVIIAAFTLVGLLHKQWKFPAVFCGVAVLFPVSWMIGNHLEYGDFLYSNTLNTVGNIEKQGVNDNVDAVLRIRRLVFLPYSFMVNVSPIVAVLILLGLVSAAIRKSLTKTQFIWLVPFLILASVFLYKTYTGTLMMQHRFVITWILLLLPFLALVFNSNAYPKLKHALLLLAIVSLIPMSYQWGWINHRSVFGKGNLSEALNRMGAENSHEFEAVPFLYSEETDLLVASVNLNSKPNEGLVLDFFGWERTYYAALRIKTRGIIMDGMHHSALSLESLDQYLSAYPSGLMVLGQKGKLLEEFVHQDSLFLIKSLGKPLSLTEVYSIQGVKLLRYRVTDNFDSDRFADSQPAMNRLYGSEKDVSFYEVVIKSDLNWYRRLQREGYWKGEPMDTTLAKNARYMVKMDSQQQ